MFLIVVIWFVLVIVIGMVLCVVMSWLSSVVVVVLLVELGLRWVVIFLVLSGLSICSRFVMFLSLCV